MRLITLHVIYIFALVLLVCFGAPPKKEQTMNTDTKLNQIRELASKSKGNVITLDDSTYSYYAISKPRPYTLIVYFTASHPKFRCTICKQLDSELSILAESYAKQMESKKEDKKIFFLRLDYESSQKVFQNYGVSSVPLLFHLSPQMLSNNNANSDKLGGGTEYEINTRDKYQVPSDPDAESIASFLQDRTSISVKIERSMFWSYIYLIVIFAILIALVQPVINSLPFWLRIVQFKALWLTVSCGVYTCAISGLIFDIIRSPQMYYANPQTGQIMFFYPQSGNQFVVEGFIIGFLNLSCAASLVLITVYAPKFKTEQARLIGMLGGIAMFAFCFRMVRNLYIMKNPWYGKQF